jgi:hypothetical protein
MSRAKTRRLFIAAFAVAAGRALAQDPIGAGPDPREIPLPPIRTAMKAMPGVKGLPVRVEMPDPLISNDGRKVATAEQWKKRRAEMRRILDYYAVGQAPPAPGNVRGREVKTEMIRDGTVKYRLVTLSFGPKQKL